MDLSVSRLRVVQAVARYGSVSAAAAALHYTPSAVSQQLAALEGTVGAELTERVGRGIRLTPVGGVLAEQATQVLAALETAGAEVEASVGRPRGVVTLGIFSSAVASVLSDALVLLAVRAPDLEVQTHELEPEHALEAVQHGDLDAALVIDYPDLPLPVPHSSLRYRSLITEVFQVAVPSGWGPREGVVPMEALAGEAWIASGPETHYRRAFVAVCQRAGFVPRVVHQIDAPATALALVAAGLGVTQVTQAGLGFRPSAIDVHRVDNPMHREIVLATRARVERRPSIAAVVDAFGEIADRPSWRSQRRTRGQSHPSPATIGSSPKASPR